jgi:hypothetical protein
MIDFFTGIYSSIQSRNRFLNKIRFYSLLRFIIRNLANVIVPISLKVSNIIRPCEIISKKKNTPRLIISLTTFPARINKIWIVIECMLRQTHQPDKIVLWLSKEQFPQLSDLPQSLLKLQKRGLEIVLCDGDLRSHKKYYYTLNSYPDDILITIDDDFIYRTTLINDLVTLYVKHPKAICCDRALIIKTVDGEILSYIKWEPVKRGVGPSFKLFHTSGGGTLYPPKSLSYEVLNKEVFMEHCKYADDVWLNVMAQINKTQTIKTDLDTIWLPILNKGNSMLTTINVDEGQNDKQLEAVRNYYKNKLDIDPLENVFIN